MMSHLLGREPSAANYKDRDVEFVANRVDGVAEDQVLDASVSVGTHHEQIGMDLTGVAQNLFTWIRPVADGSFDCDLHLTQRIDQTVEIFAPRFDFSRRRLGTVDLAVDALLDV